MFLFNALQFCATDKSNLPSYTGINWDGRLWRVGRCRLTLNRWKWRKFCTLDAPGDKSLFRWESRLVLKLEGVLCFAKADAILELLYLAQSCSFRSYIDSKEQNLLSVDVRYMGPKLNFHVRFWSNICKILSQSLLHMGSYNQTQYYRAPTWQKLNYGDAVIFQLEN